ncbi:MAG: amidohydrolase family protein, partial [Candidatus Velamenicoccus archaeovorus]
MVLVLSGGTVVRSLDPPMVAPADVVVEGGRILGLGGAAPAGAHAIDCSGCLVIPGNVCAHHHLYSALARGMPYRLEPPDGFVQILQRVWWRLDRALDPGDVELSALAGGADALLSGTTTIVDHHASPNAIEGSLQRLAGPLVELGVRAVLCYEVTDRDGPERAAAGIEENRRFLKEPLPLVRGMVGAHASFTLSEGTLAGCVEAA